MSKYKPKPIPNRKFQKRTLRLKDNHTWVAPEGYKVFVVDRGAASFNIPADWILAKLEPHVEFHDSKPPDDHARLSVSIWQTPPGIDWNGLPLDMLLEKSAEGGEVKVLERSPITRVDRDDIEVVWTEHRFLDTVEPREAYTRITLARGFNVHLLITFDYWCDEQAQFLPVWQEAIRSLQMGRKIDDPLRGPILH